MTWHSRLPSARGMITAFTGALQRAAHFQVTLCYKGFVRREFSAGGVLVRRLRGIWVMAAIRPAGKEPGVWALPKGLIGDGEPPDETALREVAEETSVEGRLVDKLGDVRYVYTWRGERVFKVVSFYLQIGRAS